MDLQYLPPDCLCPDSACTQTVHCTLYTVQYYIVTGLTESTADLSIIPCWATWQLVPIVKWQKFNGNNVILWTTVHYSEQYTVHTEFLKVTDTRTCVRAKNGWLCATISDLYVQTGNLNTFDSIFLTFWHLFTPMRCTLSVFFPIFLAHIFLTWKLTTQNKQHLECLSAQCSLPLVH